MTNQEVADLLRKIAAAFEIKDDNFFRVRAYQNAAASIEHATSDLHDIWQEGKLNDISGVGANLVQHLDELFTTGKVKHFENEVKGLPLGMFEILGVPGIGAKTSYKLAKAFKLDDPKTAKKKLKEVALRGLISELEGFGKQSEAEILQGLEVERPDDRMLLPEASLLAEDLINYLKEDESVEKVEVLGSLRRRMATIGDVDLAVATKNPKKVMEHLLRFKGIKKVLSTGLKTTMFIHSSGRRVDVKTQDPKAWGSMLQHYTGSKLHNIHLRTYALEKHKSLSEHGVKVGKNLKSFETEEDFYKFLGLEWIPPEIREDAGEIEAALKGRIPKLIEPTDIKGDLHLHTPIEINTSHDSGQSSLTELLKKAALLGYEYIGVSDHNPKSLLSLQQKIDLVKRRNEIIEKELSSFENIVKTGVPRVIKGLEVDIRPDGQLALEDEVLKLLDYAIVSVHSVFNQDKKVATKRVLSALDHPKVKIFGHPTGRMLQKRQGLDYDWDKVFEVCAKKDIWLEVNSSWMRLDLPDVLIRDAVKNGVKLVIDTDSHEVAHMEFMKYGVWTARRGWAKKNDVINTLSWGDFSKMLAGK